jgi:ribose transport system substrate-binding protein
MKKIALMTVTIVFSVALITGAFLQDARAEEMMINASIPESAQYVYTLDETTPIYANLETLGSDAEAKLGRKPVVLVSIAHLVNDWNRVVATSVINQLKELGAEVITTNAQGDWNQQASDIESGIAKGVDAIVVSGGYGKSLQEVLKKTQEAGIIVTGVDIPSPYILTNVTSDNYSGSGMVTQRMALDMGGKGNFAILHSAGWHTCDIRRWMVDEIMKDYPAINLVADQPVDDNDALQGAITTTENLLQKFPKGELDAIWTSWGIPSIGATKALIQAGRTDVKVYTHDSDIIVLKTMLQPNSPLTACMGQTCKQLGATAAVAALKGIVGDTEGIQVQTFVALPLVTKENAEAVGKFQYGDEWK